MVSTEMTVGRSSFRREYNPNLVRLIAASAVFFCPPLTFMGGTTGSPAISDTPVVG